MPHYHFKTHITYAKMLNMKCSLLCKSEGFSVLSPFFILSTSSQAVRKISYVCYAVLS